jgi:hypothetical protein
MSGQSGERCHDTQAAWNFNDQDGSDFATVSAWSKTISNQGLDAPAF